MASRAARDNSTPNAMDSVDSADSGTQTSSPNIHFADDVDDDEHTNPLFRHRSRAETIGHQWNANTSFDPTPDETPPQSWSPTGAGSNAGSGIELLRRLSLVNSQPIDLKYDPISAYPSLNLTGRVISATSCVPYSVSYATGRSDPWDLRSRRGTSALFDSFSYLSSKDSPWSHTLLGWTGEIRRLAESSQSADRNGMPPLEITPLNKNSAPIILNGSSQYHDPSHHDTFYISGADRRLLEKRFKGDEGGEIIPVWLYDELDKDDDDAKFSDQAKWRSYAEDELYTLFHYKQNEPNDGRETSIAWADYYRLNVAFRDKIMETYKPGDVVVVHDYHLLLLPSLLRQAMPTMYIGYFNHIPWPSQELFRCLSRRTEILEGILGADTIGLQAFSYAMHFASCCQRATNPFPSSEAQVEAFGRHISIEVAPIGINASATQHAAFGSHAVEEKIHALRDLYAGKKIIVGRDRLDTVRGVAQKLQAYECFLERHPEWHEKVVLIQVTSPTSGGNRDHKADKTANEISDLVTRINGTYGSLRFTPVQHFPQYLSPEEYFALLRIADIGLITSVRDGMNTTSLEYIICQRDSHGPLMLSEFSGTAASLGHSIQINPWDLGGTANEIHKALTMSAEAKQEMHSKLYNYVKKNTVQAWTEHFIQSLLTNVAASDQSKAIPVLDNMKALKHYQNSSRRLFMFDYDGTLTPIVKDPQAAIPSEALKTALKTLVSDPKNSVWIISGRDQAFLEEWLGPIAELGLSAEHGSFLRYPSSDHWENLSEKEDMSWQAKVIEVFQAYTERTAGSFFERKKIALTWHYRRAEYEWGEFQAKHLKNHLERTVARHWDVEVMPGKKNIEVRPTFLNKGEIAKRLVEEYGSEVGSAPDFVLCLGDDFTDEDMFQSLRNSKLPTENVFSVTVGPSSKKTLATWHVLEPSDVLTTVQLLNGSVDPETAGNVEDAFDHDERRW